MASADSSAMLRNTSFGWRWVSAGRTAWPSGSSSRIDAGAVQDERQKMPNAGVGIDDKAQRCACLGAGRFGLGRCGNAG